MEVRGTKYEVRSCRAGAGRGPWGGASFYGVLRGGDGEKRSAVRVRGRKWGRNANRVLGGGRIGQCRGWHLSVCEVCLLG